MARSPDGQMTRSVLAVTAEPSPELRAPAAPFEAVPLKTTPLKSASLRSASLKSAIKAATVGASIIWMSPSVVPGACADKDPVREPARAIVAVGCASIRIVRVIAVSANRRSSHVAIAGAGAEADSHSDSDLSLRISKRQRQ